MTMLLIVPLSFPLGPLAMLFGVGLCVCLVVGLWAARQDRRR